GMRHAGQMQIATKIGTTLSEDAFNVQTQWTQIGPGPIRDPGTGQITASGGTLSGLVTDIAIDPSGTSDTVIYVATDAGGIWKSTDGGGSWKPKTDFMPAISMGA